MSDFERAAQIVFRSSNVDAKLRTQAEQYLSQLQQREEGWTISLAALQKSLTTYDEASEPILFWCMGTLVQCVPRRFPQMPEEERDQFCDLLTAWLATVVPTRTVPLFIKNKISQLVVVTFEQQWPARWPQFWPVLFDLLPKSVHFLDVFLRILDTIDERIVDQDFVSDRRRSTLIKDAMRERCVVDIVSTWYNILGAFHKTNPDLSRRCLQCMQNYIEWIDIQLVSSEQWVNLLFYLFTLDTLREETCDCLFEIVSKRMENPLRKLQLVQRLNICAMLPAILARLVAEVERDGEDYEEEQTGLKIARLATTVGMELLDIIEKAEAHPNQSSATPDSRAQAQQTSQETYALLDALLPSLFAVFGAPHCAVSAAMLDFITQYVAKLKREPTLTERHHLHILSLLTIIARGIEYSDRYNFAAPEDDYETQVADRRKSLFTVFRNLCAKAPQLGQQAVHQRLAAVLANLHSPQCTWPSVEAALALLFTLGEGSTGDVFQDATSPYSQCMELLTASAVSRHPHQAVQAMFFELCERYHPFFVARPAALPSVLAAFLDDRGIRNPTVAVAARAAYLFKNFVLQLKPMVASFIDQVYTALCDTLAQCSAPPSAPRPPLGPEEQLNLFETVGLLLGAEHLPFARTVPYLEGTVAPLVSRMQVAVAGGKLPGTSSEAAAEAQSQAHHIAAIAYLSKGFRTPSLPLEVPGKDKAARGDLAPVFLKLLGAVLAVFEAGGHHAPIRDRTLLVVHRMVDLLGDRMAPYVPKITVALLAQASLLDAPKALRVPAQFAKKVKAAGAPALSELFGPTATRVFELSGVAAVKRQNSVISEEVRQHTELLRSFYYLLVCLLTSNCSEVLLCPQNRPQLDTILQNVVQGCTTHPELDLAKISFQVLTEMVTQWHSLDGFREYVQGQVLLTSFEALCHPQFDPRDAKAALVLLDAAQFHKAMLQAYGPVFLQSVETLVRAAVKDPQAAQQYLRALQEAPAKEYRTALRELLQVRRREEGFR